MPRGMLFEVSNEWFPLPGAPMEEKKHKQKLYLKEKSTIGLEVKIPKGISLHIQNKSSAWKRICLIKYMQNLRRRLFYSLLYPEFVEG